MTARATHSVLPPQKPTFLAVSGVHIDTPEWDMLGSTKIVARAHMQVGYSETHRRFLLSAEESGGATEDIGHYWGFLPLADDPTYFVRPITLAMPNTVHADVTAASLVSIEMFRCGISYKVKIALHWLTAAQHNPSQPVHRQRVLFADSFGVLMNALWLEDKNTQMGAFLPAFHSRFGDPRLIPEALREAVGAITDGVCCVFCRKSHLLALNPISLPTELSVPEALIPVLRAPAPVLVPARATPSSPAAPSATLSKTQKKNKRRRERNRRKKLLKQQVDMNSQYAESAARLEQQNGVLTEVPS